MYFQIKVSIFFLLRCFAFSWRRAFFFYFLCRLPSSLSSLISFFLKKDTVFHIYIMSIKSLGMEIHQQETYQVIIFYVLSISLAKLLEFSESSHVGSISVSWMTIKDYTCEDEACRNGNAKIKQLNIQILSS